MRFCSLLASSSARVFLGTEGDDFPGDLGGGGGGGGAPDAEDVEVGTGGAGPSRGVGEIEGEGVEVACVGVRGVEFGVGIGVKFCVGVGVKVGVGVGVRFCVGVGVKVGACVACVGVCAEKSDPCCVRLLEDPERTATGGWE